MSETPQAAGNTTEARTETGALKDQSPAPAATEAAPTTPPPETKSPVETKPAEKPTDDGKSLLNKEEKPADKPAGPPEKYEDFKAPEGFDIDKEAIGEAVPLFKELGLNQDQAQKLVDFYANVSQKAADAPMKLWQETQQKWIDEVKANPEIGGKLDQVKATVARAIDGLGDPKLASDFREAMDYTGAGNNPAFILTFYKLAAKISEGANVVGNRPSELGQIRPGSEPKSAAHALFPNLP